MHKSTYRQDTFPPNHLIGHAEELPGDDAHVRDGGGRGEPDLLKGPDTCQEEGEGIEKRACGLWEGMPLDAGLKGAEKFPHFTCLYAVLWMRVCMVCSSVVAAGGCLTCGAGVSKPAASCEIKWKPFAAVYKPKAKDKGQWSKPCHPRTQRGKAYHIFAKGTDLKQ